MLTDNQRREACIEQLSARFGVTQPTFERAFDDVPTGVLEKLASGEGRTNSADRDPTMFTAPPWDPYGATEPVDDVELSRLNRQTEGALDDIPVPGEARDEASRTNETDASGEGVRVPAPGTDPREAPDPSELVDAEEAGQPSADGVARHNDESLEDVGLDDIPVAGVPRED